MDTFGPGTNGLDDEIVIKVENDKSDEKSTLGVKPFCKNILLFALFPLMWIIIAIIIINIVISKKEEEKKKTITCIHAIHDTTIATKIISDEFKDIERIEIFIDGEKSTNNEYKFYNEMLIFNKLYGQKFMKINMNNTILVFLT